jgi:outer membrane protein assembly factor BamB
MLMHDAQRTGVYPGPEPSEMYDAQIKWTTDIPTLSASPVIGDIDSDGGMEVVVAGSNNYVYALHGLDGTIEWSAPVDNRIYSSSPAIGDLDGDGFFEVVVGTENGTLYALNGGGGSVQWTINVGRSIWSSPIIADIDGVPATTEIVLTFSDTTICFNGADGSIKWSAQTGSSTKWIHSSPAWAILDGTAGIVVVVAGNNSTIYALNGVDGSIKWTASIGPVGMDGSPPILMLTPAIGDIDNDGEKDVVVHGFDGKVNAFCGTDGADKWVSAIQDLFTGTCVNSGTALADIDSDGRLEILVRMSGIVALDEYTGVQLSSYTFPSSSMVAPIPVAADLDSDGKLEVIGGNHAGYCALLEGEDLSLKWGIQIISGDIHPSHAIGDIDGDGCLEIVGAGCLGPIYAFDSDCSVGIEDNETEPSSANLKVLSSGNRLTIRFSLDNASETLLSVFDVCGRKRGHLSLGRLNSGNHEAGFDASEFGNSVYFVQLSAGDKRSVQKVAIVR